MEIGPQIKFNEERSDLIHSPKSSHRYRGDLQEVRGLQAEGGESGAADQGRQEIPLRAGGGEGGREGGVHQEDRTPGGDHQEEGEGGGRQVQSAGQEGKRRQSQRHCNVLSRAFLS